VAAAPSRPSAALAALRAWAGISRKARTLPATPLCKRKPIVMYLLSTCVSERHAPVS